MIDSGAFIMSLIAGVAVGGTAAYLGSLMISRQMALVGDALGHVALPGMGLALLFNLDPSLGAFAFLILGILIIWKLSSLIPLSMETLVGIVFVSSLAAGFLIVPRPELLESLVGDVSGITRVSGLVTVVICALVFFMIKAIYPGLMLSNISPDLAAVEGINQQKFNFLYLLSVTFIVSLGVKVTGTLLVGALVILPPATSRVISSNLKRYTRLSFLIGALSSLIGILISARTHFPSGPSVILVNGFLFFSALVWRGLKIQLR